MTFEEMLHDKAMRAARKCGDDCRIADVIRRNTHWLKYLRCDRCQKGKRKVAVMVVPAMGIVLCEAHYQDVLAESESA
jgi:hypothetical protein